MIIETETHDRPARILLTGGRSAVALELARLFHAAGHTVYAAESIPYHLCRVSRCIERSFRVPAPARDPAGFAEALRDIALDNGIDALIPTCEEIFHIAREQSRLLGACRVFAANLDDLDLLHHKGKFIRLAEQAGLPVPATESVDSPDSWLPLLKDERFRDGIVLKPAYSRFASRVIKIDRQEDGGWKRRNDRTRSRSALGSSDASRDDHAIMRKLAASGVSPARPWIAQALLRGDEWCTYGVAHGGELTAHAAYRSRFRAGLGASIHYAAASCPPLLDWVRRFVRHTGFTGQIAFDFMVAPDGGVLPMECNPRATSGIHLFGPGDRLAEAILRPDALLRLGEIASPGAAAGSGAMVSAAMWTYGFAQACRQRRMREWMRACRVSRDAVYRRGDARPSFEQFRLLGWALRTAGKQSLSLQEAMTSDIEWNGER